MAVFFISHGNHPKAEHLFIHLYLRRLCDWSFQCIVPLPKILYARRVWTYPDPDGHCVDPFHDLYSRNIASGHEVLPFLQTLPAEREKRIANVGFNDWNFNVCASLHRISSYWANCAEEIRRQITYSGQSPQVGYPIDHFPSGIIHAWGILLDLWQNNTCQFLKRIHVQDRCPAVNPGLDIGYCQWIWHIHWNLCLSVFHSGCYSGMVTCEKSVF